MKQRTIKWNVHGLSFWSPLAWLLWPGRKLLFMALPQTPTRTMFTVSLGVACTSVRQGWAHHSGSAVSHLHSCAELRPRGSWGLERRGTFSETLTASFPALELPVTPALLREERKYRRKEANLDCPFLRVCRSSTKVTNSLWSKPGVPTDVLDKALQTAACFPFGLSVFWKGALSQCVLACLSGTLCPVASHACWLPVELNLGSYLSLEENTLTILSCTSWKAGQDCCPFIPLHMTSCTEG